MAFVLHVLIIDAGDHTIKVGHEFFGLTEKECQTYFREHTGTCEYFAAAVKENRVIVEWEEVDEEDLPDPFDIDMEPDESG